MKSFLLSLIIVIAASLTLQAQSKDNQLKVISYNIWNGFDWGKDQQRRTDLQNWMNNQDADVVALQELCKYTPEKLKEDALKWGHNYSVLLKETGYSVGITSRYPIELKEKITKGLHHGALHCQIKGIDFIVVHLHPGSIKRRGEEVGILREKIKQVKKKNPAYIILGDFNAHSPFDADLYLADGLLKEKYREGNKDKGIKGNFFNDDLDYSVMASFLSLPLYDVIASHTKGIAERGSFPGRALGKVYNRTTEDLVASLERIDYILVSAVLQKKCTTAGVYNGASNWYLSDHYPVFAVFNWSGQ